MKQLLIILLSFLIPLSAVTDITIFALTNLDHALGQSIAGGQWLAIQQINNNSDFLSNYTFNLQAYDTSDSRQKAVTLAINVSQHENTENKTYFPIILGATYSSLSTSTNLVLGAFKKGQISAAATSITLSQTNTYPYFYRTVPSDKAQADGLVLLCNTFNWTSIAIIYVNDEWGLYLSLGIQKTAKIYNIKTASIAMSLEGEENLDAGSFINAAQQIKDLNIFIIILIMHDSHLLEIMNIFHSQGIIGYPYFFLCVDGWIQESYISVHIEDNLAAKTQGFIGTTIWKTNSLSINQYESSLKQTINKSMMMYENILNLWSFNYNNGYKQKLYDIEMPGQYMIYGYDNIYSIIYAMKEIEDNPDLYGGNFMDLIRNEDNTGKYVIDILNDIIINKINFIGVSGHVIFDENGDRLNGLHSFGNSFGNGSVNYFGYFYQDINGKLISKINKEKIIWPSYFVEKGIIPHSEILTYRKIKTIDTSIYMTMFILLGLSFILSLIHVILLIFYQNDAIIRMASWKLNVIMCIGTILGYVTAILYGIGESLNENVSLLSILCNVRLWMATMSYTVLFMPLFLKTYRLSRIFNTILQKKTINDKRLFINIFICVIIDIILLIIFTSIKPLMRVYVNGSIEIMDELQQIVYIHGDCSYDKHGHTNWSMYGIIFFWKLCELFFGIYVIVDVSRIDDVTNMLTKFDETGIQLISILCTVIIVLLSVPIFIFGPINEPNFYFLTMSVTIILIGNIVLLLNLSPRLYAAITGDQNEKYGLSPTKRFEAKLKKRISNLHLDEKRETGRVQLTSNFAD